MTVASQDGDQLLSTVLFSKDTGEYSITDLVQGKWWPWVTNDSSFSAVSGWCGGFTMMDIVASFHA